MIYWHMVSYYATFIICYSFKKLTNARYVLKRALKHNSIVNYITNQIIEINLLKPHFGIGALL